MKVFKSGEKKTKQQKEQRRELKIFRFIQNMWTKRSNTTWLMQLFFVEF